MPAFKGVEGAARCLISPQNGKSSQAAEVERTIRPRARGVNMDVLSANSAAQYQRLLDRPATGDEAARRELLNASAHRLRAIARQQLRRFPCMERWVESDDVLQEAAISLYRSLQDVRLPTVLDYLRFSAAQMRRVLVNLWRHFYGPEGLGANHATPGPDLSAGDARGVEVAEADARGDPARLAEFGEVHETIQRLPVELRDAFDLLWYQQLKYAEAAALLGVSERQVGRTWREAKIALRERLPNWVE
jgi:RNA polymerase sigma factor (sigma-70 family)